jgi:ribulose-phosphate 3-epimerase
MGNSAARPARRLKLSASIMCANLIDLGRDMSELERKGFDYLHFDLMDGRFVPEIGLGVALLEQISRAGSLPVDAHLMVTDPECFVDPLISAGASLICLHCESHGDIPRLLSKIRGQGVLTGLALRPETNLAAVLPSLDVLDLVLLMAYAPGMRNQKPVPEFERRILQMRALADAHDRRDVDIAVDGGVSLAHLPSYRDSGATFFIFGTAGLFIPNTSLADQVDRIRATLGDEDGVHRPARPAVKSAASSCSQPSD